jgi:hypothetical protein
LNIGATVAANYRPRRVISSRTGWITGPHDDLDLLGCVDGMPEND